jgi:acyl-CoA dehydrogenase
MPDFKLTDEQKLVQETMREFAQKELRAVALECDEKSTFPEEVLDKLWEMGVCATPIPEAYGGFDLERSVLSSTIMVEELAHGDLSIALGALSPAMLMVPVLEFGTEEQKQQWLPKFCGETFYAATAALMEPRVTFDPFELKTSAEVRGDKVIINGTKCMVPLADRAEQILVYAQGADQVTETYIVDRDTPGMIVGTREKYMGLRPLPLFTVTFSDCTVDLNRRVGGESGIDYKRLLNLSRTTLGAMAVGVSRASLEYALEYAKERTAFGEPIASRQSIAFMLAEAAMEIDAMRLLVWQAAWRLDRGEEATRDTTLARNYCAEQSIKIVDYGVQVLGGHGYIREHPVEMWLRNGRAFATLEGLVIA